MSEYVTALKIFDRAQYPSERGKRYSVDKVIGIYNGENASGLSYLNQEAFWYKGRAAAIKALRQLASEDRCIGFDTDGSIVCDYRAGEQ